MAAEVHCQRPPAGAQSLHLCTSTECLSSSIYQPSRILYSPSLSFSRFHNHVVVQQVVDVDEIMCTLLWCGTNISKGEGNEDIEIAVLAKLNVIYARLLLEQAILGACAIARIEEQSSDETPSN